MRRRLDLASSLTTEPRILFLDEPTTGLDPRSRNAIWGIVRELIRDGTTVLLTTQYLEEADELADRIAVIDHGRVIAEGTGNELKDRVGGHLLEVELVNAGQREQACVALAAIGCSDPEPDERRDRLVVPAPAEDGTQPVRRSWVRWPPIVALAAFSTSHDRPLTRAALAAMWPWRRWLLASGASRMSSRTMQHVATVVARKGCAARWSGSWRVRPAPRACRTPTRREVEALQLHHRPPSRGGRRGYPSVISSTAAVLSAPRPRPTRARISACRPRAGSSRQATGVAPVGAPAARRRPQTSRSTPPSASVFAELDSLHASRGSLTSRTILRGRSRVCDRHMSASGDAFSCEPAGSRWCCEGARLAGQMASLRRERGAAGSELSGDSSACPATTVRTQQQSAKYSTRLQQVDGEGREQG